MRRSPTILALVLAATLFATAAFSMTTGKAPPGNGTAAVTAINKAAPDVALDTGQATLTAKYMATWQNGAPNIPMATNPNQANVKQQTKALNWTHATVTLNQATAISSSSTTTMKATPAINANLTMTNVATIDTGQAAANKAMKKAFQIHVQGRTGSNYGASAVGIRS